MVELMPPVIRLLSHPEPELQHTALKAVSNLVLDLASAKVSVSHASVMQDQWKIGRTRYQHTATRGSSKL